MSVTLRPNEIKLKTQTGEYQSPIVLGDTTIADHVAQVNAAITAKGEETLESIPEDYTELSGEVDDLKSAIKADTGTEYIDSWVNGYRAGTGNASISTPTAQSGRRFAKVSCSAGDVFTINASGLSSYRVYAFTDENGTILARGAASVSLTDAVITAPTNSAYLYINDTDPGGLSLKGASTKSQIARINTNVTNITPLINRVESLMTESGGIYESTHEVRASSIYAHTKPIAVKNGDIVCASMFTTRAYSVLSVYSSDVISASTYLYSVIGNDTKIRKDVLWKATQDCYVVFTTNIDRYDLSYAYVLNSEGDSERAEFFNTSYINEYLKHPSNVVVESECVVGKSISSSGVITTNPDTMISNKIPITSAGSLSVQSWQSASVNKWLAINFYNDQDVFISRHEFVSASFENGYLFVPLGSIAIPADSAYCIIAVRYVEGDKLMATYSQIASAYESAKQSENTNVYHNYEIKSANHRGYVTKPENTVLAFAESKRQGFEYIENDVRWTSDGVAVLLHDETINRVARNADGTELAETVYINAITYEQALTYDFGIYKGIQYAGTKICTLEECLRFCRNAGIGVYLEPKVTGHAQEVVNMVKRYNMLEHTIFLAFNVAIATQISAIVPNATYAILRSNLNDDVINACIALKTSDNVVYACVDYTSEMITEERIATLIQNDIKLGVYTVNSASAILALNPYVSSVTSDLLVAGDVLVNNALSI